MADSTTPTSMPNPPTPAGGFQQGGWYQGRQFYNGQFGAPNQIIDPNEVGTGGQVSSEVMKQSSVAQTGDPQALQKYFDNYGKVIQDNLKGIDLASAGSDAAVGGAINSGRPQPPNLTQTYETLAGQYGVSNLMTQINTLTEQKTKVQQSVLNAAQDTEAQPGVTADVVAGRESQQTIQANRQIQQIDDQITTLTNQLNVANSAVSMIMQFTQQDYTNASQAWDAQFSQYIQLQQLYNAQAQRTQQIASANWSSIVGLIQTGAIDISSLTSAQKAQINTFETAAGLPTGITEQITANNQIQSVTPIANSLNQAIIQHKNGSIEVQSLSNYGYTPPNIFQQIGQFFGFGGGSSQPSAAGYTIKSVK